MIAISLITPSCNRNTFVAILILFLFFTSNDLSAQLYQDVWHKDWVSQQEDSTSLTGRNLSITAGDFVYEARHLVNVHGKQDMALEKRSLKGVTQWVDTFNLSATTANILLADMVLDGNANIIVTGAVFNGANNYDALTLKYTTNGVLDWYQLYDGTDSFYDGGARLTVDNSNNIFVTGGVFSVQDDMNIMLLAYQSDGTLIWNHDIDGNGLFDIGSSLQISTNGTLMMTGLNQNSSTSWRVKIFYFNTVTGQFLSGATSSIIQIDEIRDVWIDASDHVYVTGWKSTTAQGHDIVTVKLTNGAIEEWTQIYNSSSNLDDESNALAIAANGDVIIGGYSNIMGQANDGLLLAYNSSGVLQWQKNINGVANDDDEVTDIVIDDNAGEFYLCGTIQDDKTADYLFEQRDLSTGSLLYHTSFNGWVGEDDRAELILKDDANGLILSGKAGIGNEKTGTASIRYMLKDYFIPPNAEAFSDNLPYIKNHDQLLTTEEKIAEEVKYYANGSPSCYFQNNGMSMVLARIDTSVTTPDTMFRVDVSFGSNKNHNTFSLDKRSSYNNYYLDHITEGRPKVPHYDQVLHTDAWEGIDVLHGSNQAGLTYTFIVEPGVDAAAVEMTFTGQNNLSLNANSELVVSTDLGDITWPVPIAEEYDVQSNAYPTLTAPTYVITGSKVKISVANAAAGRYLVVRVKKDTGPTAFASNHWITYFGASSDDSEGPEYENFTSLDVDANNHLFLGGSTMLEELPVNTGPLTLYGSLNSDFENALLVKFNEADVFQYGTIFGGTKSDICHDMALYGDNIFMVGSTDSPVFPVTDDNSDVDLFDGFIGSFEKSDGSRILIELFHGPFDEYLTAIDISDDGRLFVAGSSNSQNVPILVNQTGAYNQSADSSPNELVILEMDIHLNTIWSTFFGHYSAIANERINDLIIKPNNKGFFITGIASNLAYTASANTPPPSNGVTGFPKYKQNATDTQFPYNNGGGEPENSDLFIAEFDNNNQLLWTTFIGGHSHEHEFPASHSNLAINPNNVDEIAIVGKTRDFASFPSSPFTSGYQQTTNNGRKDFILTFNNRQVNWISSFGGHSPISYGYAQNTVNYDNNGNIIITGATAYGPVSVADQCLPPLYNELFPYCPPPPNSFEFDQGTFSDFFLNIQDIYIAIFSPDKNLRYATYLGGDRQDWANDAFFDLQNNLLYLGGGSTSRNDLPVEFPPGAYMQDELMGVGDGLIARLFFNHSITVNTDELSSQQSLNVFPNPANAKITIELPSEYGSANIKDIPFQFFNAIGQQINFSMIYDKTNGRIELDLSAFPSGMYIYKIGDFTGQFLKLNE